MRALVTRSAVAASTGENELLAAADLVSVSRLLQGKAKVDPGTATAWTPLIVAASYGHDAVADALLQNGAAPDRTDPRQGQTPLIWAAQNARPRVVTLLLKTGALVVPRSRSRRQIGESFPSERP